MAEYKSVVSANSSAAPWGTFYLISRIGKGIMPQSSFARLHNGSKNAPRVERDECFGEPTLRRALNWLHR